MIEIVVASVLTAIVVSLVAWMLVSKKMSGIKEDLLVANERNTGLTESIARTDRELSDCRQQLREISVELSDKKEALAKEVQAKESIVEQLSTAASEKTVLVAKYDELQKQWAELSAEHSALKAKQAERDASVQKQFEQFEQQKADLKKEFENLANKIFDEKGKAFSDNSKTSLDAMLKPFKEQIEGFQKRTNEIHDAALKGNTNLEAEIRKVLEVGMKMQDEANNLTAALKGKSQKRGAWGELQLERALEMSGLIEGPHFKGQDSFKDEEGKDKKTDYIVYLPNKKHIIIDSKVQLVDYDRYVSAESDDEAAKALEGHIKAVKKHIDDLASKKYTNLQGIDSPSFILMFMPIEPAYIEALKHEKDLFSYGYQKGVVLVSHTTLIPILNTVSNLWILQESNSKAIELGDKAVEIYSQVCTVAERFKKLGGTMTTASKHYNDTLTALVGQQGLHGKVERFKTFSSKVAKNMPELQPVHADVEHERLEVLIEALPEPENEGHESLESADKEE